MTFNGVGQARCERAGATGCGRGRDGEMELLRGHVAARVMDGAFPERARNAGIHCVAKGRVAYGEGEFVLDYGAVRNIGGLHVGHTSAVDIRLGETPADADDGAVKHQVPVLRQAFERVYQLPQWGRLAGVGWIAVHIRDLEQGAVDDFGFTLVERQRAALRRMKVNAHDRVVVVRLYHQGDGLAGGCARAGAAARVSHRDPVGRSNCGRVVRLGTVMEELESSCDVARIHAGQGCGAAQHFARVDSVVVVAVEEQRPLSIVLDIVDDDAGVGQGVECVAQGNRRGDYLDLPFQQGNWRVAKAWRHVLGCNVDFQRAVGRTAAAVAHGHVERLSRCGNQVGAVMGVSQIGEIGHRDHRADVYQAALVGQAALTRQALDRHHLLFEHLAYADVRIQRVGIYGQLGQAKADCSAFNRVDGDAGTQVGRVVHRGEAEMECLAAGKGIGCGGDLQGSFTREIGGRAVNHAGVGTAATIVGVAQ